MVLKWCYNDVSIVFECSLTLASLALTKVVKLNLKNIVTRVLNLVVVCFQASGCSCGVGGKILGV
jgi:hypothetical protein